MIKKIFMTSLVTATLLSSAAQAQSDRSAQREARKACFENGQAFDRETGACIARDAQQGKRGPKGKRGQKRERPQLTEEQKVAAKACRDAGQRFNLETKACGEKKAKGDALKAPGKRGPKGNRGQKRERPQLTEEQKAAAKACRDAGQRFNLETKACGEKKAKGNALKAPGNRGPKSNRGQKRERPQLTEAQKAAAKACRDAGQRFNLETESCGDKKAAKRKGAKIWKAKRGPKANRANRTEEEKAAAQACRDAGKGFNQKTKECVEKTGERKFGSKKGSKNGKFRSRRPAVVKSEIVDLPANNKQPANVDNKAAEETPKSPLEVYCLYLGRKWEDNSCQ